MGLLTCARTDPRVRAYDPGMVEAHQLSRRDARRLAVRAQLLTRERPTDVEDTVRALPLLQLDPTRAVAPSAELVLWSRLGSSYAARELWDLVDEQRVVELRGALRPAEDVALFRAEMDAWPGVGDLTAWQRGNAAWVEANNACRMDVLDLLRTDGPLHLRDLPDTCVQPWTSSGWNDRKNVQMLLGFLVARGEVAAAGGTGRDRLWDLAERVYPDGPEVPLEEALRLRDEQRLRSLGLARGSGPEVPGEPVVVGTAGEPAVVEGVPGPWRVDADLLEATRAERFAGRTALLSPFDRLLHDRRRMGEVFEFDYVLEMYKPAARRRWGYYALPVLHGDRLVGKVDAKAERAQGVLRVAAVHEDVPFGATVAAGVRAELADLARWLDLELELPV